MRRARQRRTLREQRRRALLAGAAGAVLLTPAAADAATFTVTNTNDAGAGSLRGAIASANAAAGADEIKFSGAGSSGTIRLTTGELPITQNANLTITGPGRDQLTISGDANNNSTADAADSRIFNVTSGSDATVSVSGLTLTRGFAGTADPGGAITSDGTSGDATLRITDAAVTQSKAENGGGIASLGELIVTNTTISGNTATDSGGGVAVQEDDALLDRVTLTGNTAVDAGGGASAEGPSSGLDVRDSTVSGNSVTGPSGRGGGLSVQIGLLKVQRSTVTTNTSSQGGGISAYTGKYGSGVFDSTVSGNTSTGAGGGVVLLPIKYDAKISQSTVSGNQAPRGAGVIVGANLAGTMTIERSTVRGNTATGDGSVGGGVLFASVGGATRLLDSTISGNSAASGGGVSVGLGQQVFKYQDGNRRGSIDLDNSTISGNTGGGIALQSYDFGSPSVRKAGDISISSTIVAGNNGPDTDRSDDATAGGITAASSLIQAPGDAPLTSTAVITGKDPQLGALGSNGGPTQTMLPAGTSPVLDQGRSGAKNTKDQRGEARLVDTALANPPGGGDGTDIGAVELASAAVVIPVTPTPSPAPAPAFAVAAGATPITSGTPLLPASLTPLTCSVTIVKLTGCDVAIRTTGPIKLSKKKTVRTGTLLAEAQPTSAAGAATLSGKAVLTADGRAVLAKFPVGVDARAVGVGSYSGANALTTSGKVHLLAGPTVTLKLNKGTTLSKSVKAQLGQLGKLITGAKTVSVSASGKSKKKAAKQAKAAGKALTAAGVKAAPATKGKKAKTRRLKVTFTL